MNKHAKEPRLKISLVIPAYNEEKLIKDCLESAKKNSTVFLHEIIVIDNASTDNTRAVAESISEIKVYTEHKKGTSAARQKGFEMATGELVAFIDADTRMPKGWCETVIAEFSNDPSLAALSGPYIYYDLPPWQKLAIRIFWRTLAYPLYMFTKYMALGGNLVMKKEVLEKMGGLDTSLTFYGDDTDMVRRASKFGKIKFKFNFTIESSGRRFSEQGLIKTGLLYSLNFFSQAVAKKPVTKEHIDIR